MAHAFVRPKNTTAEEGKNIHIFPAEKKTDGKYKTAITAYCGKVDRKLNIKFTAKDTDKGARNHAASSENDNNAVCGQCVSHLYNDGA